MIVIGGGGGGGGAPVLMNGVVSGENGDRDGIFRSMSFQWTGKVVKSPKEILFFKIIPSCRYLCCVFSKH